MGYLCAQNLKVMKRIILVFFALLCLNVAMAQESSVAIKSDSLVVTGKVVDESGQPIIGASVQVLSEAWENPSFTDIEGNYQVVLPGQDCAIIVKFYGFLNTIVTKENAEKIVLLEAKIDKKIRII